MIDLPFVPIRAALTLYLVSFFRMILLWGNELSKAMPDSRIPPLLTAVCGGTSSASFHTAVKRSRERRRIGVADGKCHFGHGARGIFQKRLGALDVDDFFTSPISDRHAERPSFQLLSKIALIAAIAIGRITQNRRILVWRFDVQRNKRS
jgi:hypothetical protein